MTSGRMKVVIYCRVACEDQGTNVDDRFRAQEAACEKYLAACGIDCERPEILSDIGSGMENQPNMNRLLRAAAEGDIDFVVMQSLSRISRRISVAQEIVRRLQSANVQVHLADGGLMPRFARSWFAPQGAPDASPEPN